MRRSFARPKDHSFKTTAGGSGSVAVRGFIELKDPNKLVPFAITNHFTADRVLTGADFDIESMQRAPDGTLCWARPSPPHEHRAEDRSAARTWRSHCDPRPGAGTSMIPA